jgi:hypothetical protein
LTNRNGEIRLSNNGQKMTIVRYNGCKDIDVEFEDGYIAKNRTYTDFKLNRITNYNYPSVFNVGIIGRNNEARFSDSKSYRCWVNMLSRCYNEKYKKNKPTYNDCTVCKEWIYYKNFKNWFNNNYWEIDNCVMQLDKDILIKRNKEYNPNSCCFVDIRLNSLFTKDNAMRGDYPIGVQKRKDRKDNYRAVCNTMNNKRHYIGSANNPKDAFYLYKQFKESYIKQVADEYKQKYPNFPDNLYNAMYNYEVEITD